MKKIRIVLILGLIAFGVLFYGFIRVRNDRDYFQSETVRLNEKVQQLQFDIASKNDALSRGGL